MSLTDQLHEDAPEAVHDPAPRVTGHLPVELQGTFVRNGPGIQRAGNDRFHLLDGYGFVAGLSFDGGKVTFRAKHVDTPLFRSERAAGKQLRRKVFTNKPSRWSNFGDVNLPNVANHDIYAWGGHLVATDTPGHVLLDPGTLETAGKSPLDHLKTSALANLCQMPRPDPVSGNLVVFSVQPGLGGDTVTFRELDNEWKTVAEKSQSLGGRGVVLHDLCFTKTHYLALEIGRLSIPGAAWGATSIFENILEGPLGHRIIGVPRVAGAKPFALELPDRKQAFHFINAFDRDGLIVADVAAYPHHLSFAPLNAPGPLRPAPHSEETRPNAARLVIDAERGRISLESLGGLHTDSPVINPAKAGQPYRYAYGPCDAVTGDEHTFNAYFYFHAIGKVDVLNGGLTTWKAGPTVYVSPPAFVARPGATEEDDGWLLVWTMDAEVSHSNVVVLDARDIAAGPVATVSLKQRLPAVSHSEWVPGNVLTK